MAIPRREITSGYFSSNSVFFSTEFPLLVVSSHPFFARIQRTAMCILRIDICWSLQSITFPLCPSSIHLLSSSEQSTFYFRIRRPSRELALFGQSPICFLFLFYFLSIYIFFQQHIKDSRGPDGAPTCEHKLTKDVVPGIFFFFSFSSRSLFPFFFLFPLTKLSSSLCLFYAQGFVHVTS